MAKNFLTSNRNRDLLNRYFMGVMDIEVKTGKIDNMKIVDNYRIFNDKFVKSADLALLIAFDERNERWQIPASDIMKDVVYDEESKEWKRTYLETLGGHAPTEKMIEKWKRGEYILNLITEYVQIMETVLIDDKKLIETSVENWTNKMDNYRKRFDKTKLMSNSKSC